MKAIKTFDNFNLINESLVDINKAELEKVIAHLSDKFTPSLVNKIISSRHAFDGFMKKFNNDGVFDTNKLPFVSIKESKISDFNDWFMGLDYNYSDPENKIVMILKRVCLLPAYLITALVEMVIDTFQDGIVGKFISAILVIMIGLVILIFTILISFGYEYYDKKQHGIETGVVLGEPSFTPAHKKRRTQSILINKHVSRVSTVVNVPDTWTFEVKDINGSRIEKWETTDRSKLSHIETGDTVNNTEFTWVGNIQK
jgi:hypothetical protein